MEKAEILVVGGAGFIGSHVNKLLDASGFKTVILDNLVTGSKKNAIRGTLIEGDMGDRKLLDAIFSSYPIRAVMHFAAFIDVRESVFFPSKYYYNNVAKTLTLLQVMQERGIKVFIFSSSAAIFGNPQQKLINEYHPTSPINPYGSSKLMVEQMLHDFGSAYGMKFSCLRYFNAAGGDPDQEIKNTKMQESNLIPILLKSLKNGDGIITINGSDYPTKDGTCIRDFVHLNDLGSAHIAALNNLLEGHASSVYNLGNSKGFSVREVIACAKEVTGRMPKVSIGPRRQGDPPYLLADATKAKKELHWNPRYPELSKMIEHAWLSLH